MATQQALIIVDQQNGFIPLDEGGTGELGVVGGGLLSAEINTLARNIKAKGGLIIATRDWHPQGHMSFASNYEGKHPFSTLDWDEVVNDTPHKLTLAKTAAFHKEDLASELGATLSPQVLWPDHCIEGTRSAEYHQELDTSLIDRHIIKGYDPRTEMYSGFYGREDTPLTGREKGVTLTEILQQGGISLVKIVGIATDYCVKATALDALKNGLHVEVLKKAIAGVDPATSIKALEELRNAGARIVD